MTKANGATTSAFLAVLIATLHHKIKHSWTNGQVEWMNRTIKEATVTRHHNDSHAQLTAHLHDFIDANNYGWRLKTLKDLAPFEYICKMSTTNPTDLPSTQPIKRRD